jgi:catechol 2,3-dioxygenase
MAERLEDGAPPPGYRLPEATRLGRAVLQVADLARSIEYYTTVVGLRVVREAASIALLGAADDDTPLVELRERRDARPVPRRGRLGLFHVAILLPDRPALGRVLRHLGEIGIQPGLSDHFVSEALYLWDPDGLGLEIYADRPRSIWRAERGQLYMTAEPLDVAGVLAAADDAPPALPRGTVIGHVHLSVDDIPRASAFYHHAAGFDRTVWTYPGALFMSAGGYHHHLGTNTWSAGAPLASEDDARLVEWEVVVPAPTDVAAVVASLETAGHAAREGVVTDPWGVRIAFRTAARPASGA